MTKYNIEVLLNEETDVWSKILRGDTENNSVNAFKPREYASEEEAQKVAFALFKNKKGYKFRIVEADED